MDNYTKSKFRKKCIKRLKICSKLYKFRANKYVSSKILELIKQDNMKNILLYIPLKMEVDLKLLIKVLRRNKINVFVPYMISENEFKIVPFRLPLSKKKFNIYEPNNSFKYLNIKLDLAVVPIVGFDDSFRRVGFGVGFYDRYFSSLKYKPKIIFTQICSCKSNKIITQEHDINADFIITNNSIIRKEKYGI